MVGLKAQHPHDRRLHVDGDAITGSAIVLENQRIANSHIQKVYVDFCMWLVVV